MASDAPPETPNSSTTPETSASLKVPPPDEKTQPFRLRDLAPKMALKRRRSTAAELTFKRTRVDGGRTDVRVPLDRSEMVIGRDPTCDIVILEKSASARHARVVRGDGGYFEVQDLGSTNGVIVEGERVERMTLQDGDTFTVGDTRFSILVAPIVGDPG